MPRVYELPTHLDVEDTLIFGLSARQLVRLAVGATGRPVPGEPAEHPVRRRCFRATSTAWTYNQQLETERPRRKDAPLSAVSPPHTFSATATGRPEQSLC
jgi:hypothetical protein